MDTDRQGNGSDTADEGGDGAFLAAYDPRDFPAIAVTVDIVALTLRAGILHILLVERGGRPFQGAWARARAGGGGGGGGAGAGPAPPRHPTARGGPRPPRGAVGVPGGCPGPGA
ncbi:hypothetical protein ACFW1M_31195 [Streptomyces inhibens]|uniref:hypothetical protein n=1 Tax=Streptomyces inhibens TaxID=2293571 RepID=UPI0036A63A78